jgi:hypothetical protein
VKVLKNHGNGFMQHAFFIQKVPGLDNFYKEWKLKGDGEKNN